MIDDIEKIMTELAKAGNRIIVNPKTLEELKQHGIPLDNIPAPSIEELFEKRKQSALLKLQQLPTLPLGLQPDIQALYQEIRECIFFDLNGAAITMSAILIEFVLKRVTFIKECGGYQAVDLIKLDEFENMELGPAINRAKSAGILDSKMAERLHSFREIIRNPYSHYNIKKITENIVAEKVKQVNMETGEIKEIDIAAKDSPMIQAQVKPFMDEYHVMTVFGFADEVVKYLLNKI
ncbi:MAG: hypothetical protein PHS93_09785 [Candidatus Omnitrophica bacterium]|nr:hypothetical protein [Candidatus Omnitrophota bacterium]MDD5353439.1 hypothetical protein [Candidatus Omnitrophota bacterium]MDD5551444.1 hypothetical protein [Candidatus Omnitrophota bacterium]